MSDGPLVLAVDAGTGSCRAILFDRRGVQVGIGQREYSHPSVPGVPQSQTFDTATNWELICSSISEAVASAGASAERVTGVAATSMREGMVCYDSAGREIWACPNVDARASREVEELISEGAAEEIYGIAGDWVSITAPARLRWIARHEPELFRSIAHIGMLGDWILYKLSGAFVTEPSLGSSSGMFDLAQRDWSPRILEICRLDPVVVPPVVQPGTVIGEVTAAAAYQTGLRAGTPVVLAGADTQLSLVGLGVHDPGSLTIVGGSFWQHAMVTDRPLIDPQGRLRTLCHTVPERWMLEGIGFYSGLAMRWFRDAFCMAEKRDAIGRGLDVYELMEREAATVEPGSNGVVAVLSNLMDAKRWVHAPPGFLGFDLANPDRSGRKECVRAIEESAAYVSLGHMMILDELMERPLGEVTFTGGAAKGTLWPQILADVLGARVAVPAVKESTALGAALYAGSASGVFGSVEDSAAALDGGGEIFEPDPGRHATYETLFDTWRELYAGVLTLADARLAPALWRAPGA